MRRNRFLLVAFAFALSCASTPLPKPGEVGLKDFNFRMRDWKTPSGLRIIVQEDHSSPVVGVVNVVGVGSTSEPAGKEGMAHLIEHLAFRTKPSVEGHSTMWDLLEQRGAAFLNANTSFDATVYFEFGPKDALPDLIKLEAARMINPLQRINDHILDVEREVVRNELREGGESQSASTVFGWLQEAVFPSSSPYHHSVIGTHESLDSIKLADVQKFVKLYYRPDNMTMFIIGDVDLEHFEKVLDATIPRPLFGDPKNPTKIPLSRLPNDAPEPPTPPPAGKFEVHEHQVPTPMIVIGWSLPGGFRADSNFMQFVTEVLNAELSRASREDQDILEVGAFLEQGAKSSMVICQVILREGKHLESSADHVLNTLSKLWLPDELKMQQDLQASGAGAEMGGFGPSLGSGDRMAAITFDKMRMGVYTGMALSSESIVERSDTAARFAHFVGDPAFYSRSMRAMAEMEEPKIAGFANKYLTRERARIVYVKPLPASARVEVAHSGVAPTDDTGGDFNYDPAMITRLAHSPRLSDFVRTVKLKNGLEVILAKRSVIPVVTVSLLLHGGTAGAQPFGVANLAENVMRPGSHRHGDYTNYGARESRSIDPDSVNVEFHAASGNLPNMLAILSDQLKSMSVPSGIVDYFRKYIMPFLKKEDERPERRAGHEFSKAVFGEHPYGHEATVDEIAKVEPSDIDAWIKRSFSPKNAVVAIVGDIEFDSAERMAHEWLEDWTGDPAAAEIPPLSSAPPSGHTQVLVTHKPGATQGEMRLGCSLPANKPHANVLHRVMGGMASDHLFRVVRQQLGASYGIRFRGQSFRGGSSLWSLEGNITNAKLKEALKAIKTYWDSLPADVDEADMNKERWKLARAFNLQFVTTGDIANRFVTLRNLGLSLENIERYPQDLAALTKKDLQEEFKVCHESAVLSIVGDEDTINKALKEAGWK